jgi:hypothetical protein
VAARIGHYVGSEPRRLGELPALALLRQNAF